MNLIKDSIEILTVTVRDDYTPHDTRWQCTAKGIFIHVLVDFVGTLFVF